MKRVLFLAYLFPPIVNSGTQRPLKFVKYLAEYGWEPIVVTAAHFDGHPVNERLIEQLPKGVRIVRVPMLSGRIADGVKTMLGGGALACRVADGLRWRLHNGRQSPDFYSSWYPTALHASKKIFREIGFDAIFATGYPWTSLMVARAVARATGRPFVADFRDLWSGETLFREERPPQAQERAAERDVVESAAAVVGASETICRQLGNAHPSLDESKLIAIHNGFDPEDFAERPAASDAAPRPFRIAYTGVWKTSYNPGALYHSIDWIRRSAPDALEGVEVVAAGFTPGEARRRGLARYIREVGVLPHHEAIALMQSADALYLSHDNPDRQWSVPGKVYEYLASGTPVFASTDPRAETARIIRQVGGGIVLAPDDPGNLYYALLEACRRKTFAVPPLNRDAMAAFERRALTGRLANVLNAVSSRAAVATPQPRVAIPAAAARA
jgi:glycosyltransferase involved in cell wall biosynthesis